MAAGFVDHVLELHHRSQHIIYQISVNDQVFSMQRLLTASGKQVRQDLLLDPVQLSTSLCRCSEALLGSDTE